MSYYQTLRRFHTQEGFFNHYTPIPLHRNCGNSDKCWVHPEPHNGIYSGITRAHVGRFYDKTRLLVLGINNRMNYGRGNYQIESTWIKDSASIMKKSTAGVCAVHKYLAIYATLFMSINEILPKSQRIIDIDYKNQYHRKILADNLQDFLAWTQVIKCNPKRGRSKPYDQMWTNCSQRILCGEIKALKPKYIISFGISGNYPTVLELLKKEYSGQKPRIYPVGNSHIEYWKGKKGKSEIHLIGLPHPVASIEKQNIMGILSKIKV